MKKLLQILIVFLLVCCLFGCAKKNDTDIKLTSDSLQQQTNADDMPLKVICTDASFTIELIEKEALSAFSILNNGKSTMEFQIMGTDFQTIIVSYQYNHDKDWQPEYLSLSSGNNYISNIDDSSMFEANATAELFWIKTYSQTNIKNADEILLLVMDDKGQSVFEKRYYPDFTDGNGFAVVSGEAKGASGGVWPAGLPRYEKDSEFFSPVTDDFAYFATDINGIVNPSANPSAILLSYDEYGKIVQCVERMTKDSFEINFSTTDDNYRKVVAVNEFDEFCYIEYNELNRLFSDEGTGRVESYFNNKDHSLQAGFEYYGASAYSMPYLQQIKAINCCDISDISLLSYFPGLPEDYFVNVWGYEGDTQYALILEFDEMGIIKSRYAMMQFVSGTDKLMQKAKDDGFTVLSEADSMVMRKGYYFEDYENFAGATKDSLMLSFVNNNEYTKGLSYQQLREDNIDVMYFSQPYLNDSIMENINTAYTEGKWSTVIAFEKMYPDRVTYTLENFTRGEPLTQMQWVIAYENGKAVAAYTRYDTLPGEAYNYAAILGTSQKVYADKNLIFNMENNFGSLPLYGQSKDEVLRLIKADCKNVGCELVLVD